MQKRITIESIAKGLKSVKWRYRLEKVDENHKLMKLLPKNSILYIDGAHNPHGAKAISDFLSLEQQKDNISNYIINGRTKDTDSRSFLWQFLNNIKMAVAIRSTMEAIPESPEIIAKAGNEIGLKTLVAKSLEDAIKLILAFENNILEYSSIENIDNLKPVRIVICGSFYLAKLL
ncbi:folylpolyglutamate synthase/dihydrofolate synthase family protein [Candidatus Deianiraea vastatrix]|uniref:FolC-like protein (C-terminal domain) n=1 Tax=Candidatus Deianiraea vastatrix TaxID=2163644 RepID=A0A5B8XES3_9RICK|nr:hypothetical protein [Candidatus Deianiraea vastatrix]QED23763.1 FolC-like protein (C-terminal domain) [Candidatus Deianiraea vastatrix]